MNDSIFSPDFRDAPFWWDRTPRPNSGSSDLPKSADVVIVGSGYTGLSAAMQTTLHGLHTVVVDAENAGWGCSSRNGGQISTSIKPSFPQLKKRYGADAALAILQEGNKALNCVEEVVRENNLDCDFRRVGRFNGAHAPAALDLLKKKIDQTPAQLNHDSYVVEEQDQREEIGSDFYCGGVVHPHHASIDPGRYHQGLLECALSAGAEVTGQCKVMGIQPQNGSFVVETARGRIQARDVIVATSGYTGNVTPWQQHRIIPIGSYMIATEPLPHGVAEKLNPKERVISDTLDLVVYYRTCPQRKRLLFGGRVSLRETNPKVSAPRLRELMLQRFPELAAVKISHSWMGFVGYSFDHLPHIGKHNGIHYSMGYCGSGISLASYYGRMVGLKVAGDPEGETAIDRINFRGRPYYRGNPWFLAPSIFYYRWKDRLTAM
jgi:glycine/D-amino acid oxidase-like deaminating enzyme